MSPALFSRKAHKWLSLLVGVQLLLWTISGFYMVVMDLDFIHGDPLVRNLQTPLQAQAERVSFAAVAQRFPGATHISLRALPDIGNVYEISRAGEQILLSATTGEQLSPLSQDMVDRLARSYYAGTGGLAQTALLRDSPPLEIQSRPLPLWRVDFDDWLQTSLYLHPDTGVLVTRRHRFWRWFDFVWMLHIMDYDQRSDINNPLLRFTTLAGLVTVASGLWLVYFSFRRRPVTAR